MHELVKGWLPPRVSDLAVLPQDQHIYDDADGGATHYYSWYRWAASIIRPRVVVEIGVRLGYSAKAMACGERLEYFIGFDTEIFIKNSNCFAEIYLSGVYPELALHSLDTQAVTSLKPFLAGRVPDIFHIDGDHSYEGCLHDLNLAHQLVVAGSLVIVDDAAPEKAPGKACADFLCQHPHYAVLTLNDAFSFRGHHFMLRVA